MLLVGLTSGSVVAIDLEVSELAHCCSLKPLVYACRNNDKVVTKTSHDCHKLVARSCNTVATRLWHSCKYAGIETVTAL